MYEYHAVLLAVVDGDTMHVQLDLGMDLRINTILRVYGVNAPELKTVDGQRAKQWAIDWFTKHPGLLTVRTLKDKKEKYGRYLATITAADGAAFNAEILAAHMAVAYYP